MSPAELTEETHTALIKHDIRIIGLLFTENFIICNFRNILTRVKNAALTWRLTEQAL